MKSSNKIRRRFLRWLRNLVLIGPVVAVACGANGKGMGGKGMGEVNTPVAVAEPSVSLLWKSEALAPDRGQISGTLQSDTASNPTHYVGSYLEVAENAEEALYESAWDGWLRYWPEWSWEDGTAADAMDWAQFTAAYGGTVIANLRSDDGKARMRCRFIIDTPATGLAGGSNGLCQLSNGEMIDYVMLESE